MKWRGCFKKKGDDQQVMQMRIKAVDIVILFYVKTHKKVRTNRTV